MMNRDDHEVNPDDPVRLIIAGVLAVAPGASGACRSFGTQVEGRSPETRLVIGTRTAEEPDLCLGRVQSARFTRATQPSTGSGRARVLARAVDAQLRQQSEV